MFNYTFSRGTLLFWASLWVCKSLRILHQLRPWKLGRNWSQEDKLYTIVYWLNALDQSAFSLQVLCVIIKIIECVQESFCSFCKQETTGQILELKFSGLKCTLQVWCGYLYILLRMIVNESQITELKGFQGFELYLFNVRVYPASTPLLNSVT